MQCFRDNLRKKFKNFIKKLLTNENSGGIMHSNLKIKPLIKSSNEATVQILESTQAVKLRQTNAL